MNPFTSVETPDQPSHVGFVVCVVVLVLVVVVVVVVVLVVVLPLPLVVVIVVVVVSRQVQEGFKLRESKRGVRILHAHSLSALFCPGWAAPVGRVVGPGWAAQLGMF